MSKREYPRSMTLMERFEANVPERPEIGCWPWHGSIQKSTYGQISVGSRGAQVVHYAHRLAYQFYIGPIPEGMEIEHACEFKGCVRWTVDPWTREYHLRAVTHAENMERSIHRVGVPLTTHCSKGHERSEENTYWYKGKRHCKICKRESLRRYRANLSGSEN